MTKSEVIYVLFTVKDLPPKVFDTLAEKICKRYEKVCNTVDGKICAFNNTGTVGWDEDFKQSCLECNCLWFYHWYCGCDWYECDKIDSDISEIMIDSL